MPRASVGIPFSHVRALSPEERAWLSERAHGARRRRISFGCGTLLVPVILCLPLALYFVTPVAPLTMLPALWLCLWIPLKWTDARKRSAFAEATARSETADVFEGVPNAGILAEASLEELVQAGLVLDMETPQRLDRIAESGEAIGLNGARLDPPVPTDETDVAPLQYPVAEFPALVPEFAIDAPALERRSLSRAELAELRRLAPGKDALRRHGCVVGFALYTLAGLVFQRFDDEPVAFRALVYAARTLLLVYLGWQVFQASREQAKLRRDLTEGAVIRTAQEGKDVELLPHLGMAWTVDGQPASWRHAVQAGPRPPR